MQHAIYRGRTIPPTPRITKHNLQIQSNHQLHFQFRLKSRRYFGFGCQEVKFFGFQPIQRAHLQQFAQCWHQFVSSQ